VKPEIAVEIDRAFAKLTLKTGERHSRTAFIVQTVREKLARLEAEEADTIGLPPNTARPQSLVLRAVPARCPSRYVVALPSPSDINKTPQPIRANPHSGKAWLST
jgi:hypothetical protein